MNFETYNQIVNQHMDSKILIYSIIFAICVILIVFVEIYIRRKLEFRYFEFKKFRLNPSICFVTVGILTIIICLIEVNNCKLDIQNCDYETYTGTCTYQSESVKLEESGLSIYVGKGHTTVPKGTHYGKCTYSKRARVIVDWEALPENSK